MMKNTNHHHIAKVIKIAGRVMGIGFGGKGTKRL
jgi:hypothetical protein